MPGIMLGYEAYCALVAEWRKARDNGKDFYTILNDACSFFWRKKRAYTMAFLNVVPLIGYTVVTVNRDFPNLSAKIPMMILILISTVASNWLMRAKPMEVFLNSRRVTQQPG